MESSIFKILNKKNIPYAIVCGKYDSESYHMEKKSFSPDIDIILNCSSRDILNDLNENPVFDIIEDNSFKDNKANIRIDIYFRLLNVGYYHYLNIDNDSFNLNKISESEYIVYLILDPLLKFSRYHKRHKYRLNKYFISGISKNVELKLKDIIGKRLCSEILLKILNSDYEVSKNFIIMCKLRILFINGNFVRMIKKRFFL